MKVLFLESIEGTKVRYWWVVTDNKGREVAMSWADYLTLNKAKRAFSQLKLGVKEL